MKFNKCKLVVALLMFTLLVGCSGGANALDNPFNGTTEKDTVTVNLAVEPPVLNSTISIDNITDIIYNMSMVGLVSEDVNGEIVPEIAETWDVNEDNTEFVFHLRKDAKWSNGDLVTAHDFEFAWKTVMDSKTASPVAPVIYRTIKNGEKFFNGQADANELGVKAKDDYTLVVELEEASAAFINTVSNTSYLPINKKIYDQYGMDGYGSDASKIVTNGPYTIKEWAHDNYILMSKNDTYYNAKDIAIANVKYVMIGDSNAAMNAFKAGELDVFDIYGDQIADLQSQGKDVVKSYFDNTTYVLQFNMNKKETSNGKINRALSMAIDMESLCNDVFKDGSIPATGIVPPDIKGAKEDETYGKARGDILTFDQKEAKKLFDEGLKELNMKVEDFKISYSANDTPLGKIQGEYFKEQWKNILGLDVTIELMPFNSRIQKLTTGDFDFTFNGWGGTVSPSEYLSFMVKNNENNFGRYNNTNYDELIDKARAEKDEVKSQEYFIEAETLMINDGAMVPLYYTCVVYATSNKVEGMISNVSRKFDFTEGAKIREN